MQAGFSPCNQPPLARGTTISDQTAVWLAPLPSRRKANGRRER